MRVIDVGVSIGGYVGSAALESARDVYGSTMGGHQSTLKAESTANITTNALQKSMQDCDIDVQQRQNISIHGKDIYLDNLNQSMTTSTLINCDQAAQKSADIANSIANTVSQAIENSSVAGLQWMDTGSDNVSTKMTSNVKNKITQETIQNCKTNINASQQINVGDAGETEFVYVGDLNQDMATAVETKCTQADAQTLKMITDVTNTANQHASYSAENPLQPLADAAASMAKSAMMVGAIILIVLIVFALVFMGGGGGKKVQLAKAQGVVSAAVSPA